jgi:hypothetical protein
MKRLSIRILAIAVLTPMAAFGAIGSASAAPHSPAAVHRAPAAGKTAARTDDICAENPFCNKRSLNPGPRIGCGGANAVIEWIGLELQSYGEAWDNCGSGTYVKIFLSWTDPGGNNIPIATAGPNSTVGFNTGIINDGTMEVGNISITACEHDNGWHCGTPIHV